MSDPRRILERWARLKSASRVRDRDQSGRDKSIAVTNPPQAETTFDPATLPPVEAIDAATELRVFLGEGVPTELTLAALRRAWSVDPAIRDFVGLSENAWDFNDPGAMPGFGALKAEDIKELAARIVDRTDEMATAAIDHAPTTRSNVQADVTSREPAAHTATLESMSVGHPNAVQEKEVESSSPSTVAVSRNAELSAGKQVDDRQASPQRRHGSAVPRTDQSSRKP